MKQLTLAAVGFERYGKTTRRAVFLAEMDRVLPWPALCGLIEPGKARTPISSTRTAMPTGPSGLTNLEADEPRIA
jgi:transposase, IS5 family